MIAVVDTHCHYAEPELAQDSDLAQARSAGLVDALVCATHSGDFEAVNATAHAQRLHYALGVHPLLVKDKAAIESEILALEETLKTNEDDPLLAAVGEIGLDLFPGACPLELSAQIELFEAMLEASENANLPVSIHSRKALPHVMACLKKTHVTGVLHAFAGSFEEARQCFKLGFKLGFGPSLTYSGSRRIREVFTKLPEDAYVLETDAPFMLTANRRAAGETVCRPVDLFEVLQTAAELRNVSVESLAEQSTANALAVFPKLAADR